MECTTESYPDHGLKVEPWPEVLPSIRLIGMCCRIRSHLHNWNEYDGVCIFNRVTRMGSQIFEILGVTNILVNTDSPLTK